MKRILSFALLVVVWGLLNGCSLSSTHLEQLEKSNAVSGTELSSLENSNNELIDVILKDGEPDPSGMYITKSSNSRILSNSGKKEYWQIRGKFDLETTPIPVGGSTIDLEINGLGNASHLGKSQITIEKHIEVPWDGDWSANITVKVEGFKGEEFSFDFSTVVDRSQTPVMRFIGTGDLDNGTGRFENASGILHYTAGLDWDTSLGVAFISGEISY